MVRGGRGDGLGGGEMEESSMSPGVWLGLNLGEACTRDSTVGEEGRCRGVH